MDYIVHNSIVVSFGNILYESSWQKTIIYPVAETTSILGRISDVAHLLYSSLIGKVGSVADW